MHMHYKAIAIAGLPGAGKTTLIAELSKNLKWPVVHIGGFFRDAYAEWKQSSDLEYTFEEYYKKIVTQKDIEQANDWAREQLLKGSIILDSRFVPVNCIGLTNILKIFVTAPLDIRASRVSKANTLESYEKIKEHLYTREQSEFEWGNNTYGHLFGGTFDYRHARYYDILIDTGSLTPQEEVNKILSAAQ